MTLFEKKRMMVKVIRKLEDKIVSVKHLETYDGIKSFAERQDEIEALQKHLHLAHMTLATITEEEVA